MARRNCRKCGARISPTSAWCSGCGARVNSAPGLVLALIALLLLLSVVAIWLAWGGRS